MHAAKLTLLSLGLVTSVLAAPAEVKKTTDDPKLEVEVSGGVTSRSDLTPTVSARLGVDLWNWFTPSVRLVSVAPWSGSQSAWAIQAELRGHTRGSLLQLTGGIGFGLATANVVRAPTGVDADLSRPAQPWLTGDLGGRVLLGPLFLGVSGWRAVAAAVARVAQSRVRGVRRLAAGFAFFTTRFAFASFSTGNTSPSNLMAGFFARRLKSSTVRPSTCATSEPVPSANCAMAASRPSRSSAMRTFTSSCVSSACAVAEITPSLTPASPTCTTACR